jgi:hypothetical protein
MEIAMKTNILLSVFGGLAAFTLISSGAAMADPPAYELACKANSSMTATVRGNGVVTLRFRPGLTPGRPRPGECVWMDRVLNDQEPAVIQADGDFARDLVDDLLAGGRFSVSVYNDGAGHMIVAAGG